VLNYRNGASGTARGAELLVKKDAVGPGLSGKLSGFASLSLSRARRQIDATGEQFPFDFDQPVIATLVGGYKLSDRWQLGAKWSYHTGSPYTPVVGTGLYPDGRVRPVYGSINSQRVPAYHRLDLRADVRYTPRLTAYFELINAYARKNVAGYSYSADYRTREEIRQLPVLPSFGLKYVY
jgi:TonB dependent receptor